MQPKKLLTIAFDIDGVIGQYHGFQGEDQLGLPNMEVVNAIRLLDARGHTIIIHSTHETELIRTYCLAHNIPFRYINENGERKGGNSGKPIANVYVDDRAYRYQGQSTAELVHDLEEFQPHWKNCPASAKGQCTCINKNTTSV